MTATDFDRFDHNRTLIWQRKTESLDFAHSSRKAWTILKKLNGKSTSQNNKVTNVSANQIAAKLIENSKQILNKNWMKKVRCNLKRAMRKLQPNPKYSSAFSLVEPESALSNGKTNKATDYDNIFPEFIKHLGPTSKKWLLDFFNTMLNTTGKIPAIFKKSKVVAIVKPGKDG